MNLELVIMAVGLSALVDFCILYKALITRSCNELKAGFGWVVGDLRFGRSEGWRVGNFCGSSRKTVKLKSGF
jgi:hypothetical protein